MSSLNLSTLDRIQLEIKESIQREKELRNGYSNPPLTQNGFNAIPLTKPEENIKKPQNGFKKFSQNFSSTKGVMHRFIKSRGRLSMAAVNPSNNRNAWQSDKMFQSPKVFVENGKTLRNGFIPAEEKMKKELQEFQQREAQLRDERRKSQPNLMAALQLEEENDLEDFKYSNGGLKAAKSMANLYNNNSDDGFEDNSSSAGGSLKPARSLADLCDVSDEEGGLPGTHSLIMQFENMQFKNRSSSQSSKGSYSKDF